MGATTRRRGTVGRGCGAMRFGEVPSKGRRSQPSAERIWPDSARVHSMQPKPPLSTPGWIGAICRPFGQQQREAGENVSGFPIRLSKISRRFRCGGLHAGLVFHLPSGNRPDDRAVFIEYVKRTPLTHSNGKPERILPASRSGCQKPRADSVAAACTPGSYFTFRQEIVRMIVRFSLNMSRGLL